MVTLAVLVPLFILVIIAGNKAEEKEKEAKRIEKERMEKILNTKKDNYNKQKRAFIEENGNPDKSLTIEEYDFNLEIHVFKTKKKFSYWVKNIISEIL